MNVFYEEDGELKVGAVLADNDTSLQVEAPHGKRSKVKASAVLLRFESPAHTAFMAGVQHQADAIDIDFLWQCCTADEFGYDTLARTGSALEGHAESPFYFLDVLQRHEYEWLVVLVVAEISLRHQKLVHCSEPLSHEHLMLGGARWVAPMTFIFTM